jgi:dCMP deaminase
MSVLKNYLTWTEYFISIAKLVSRRSKDPNTQVGAVIINPQTNTIISTGYNGFPRGCQDDEFPWGNDSKNWLETKYPYVVHAETNAIIHAQQNCMGFIMYTNFFPCHEYAKLIIQSGIKNVFYYSNSLLSREKWKDSYLASEKMFQASGVSCQKLKTKTVKDAETADAKQE